MIIWVTEVLADCCFRQTFIFYLFIYLPFAPIYEQYVQSSMYGEVTCRNHRIHSSGHLMRTNIMQCLQKSATSVRLCQSSNYLTKNSGSFY